MTAWLIKVQRLNQDLETTREVTITLNSVFALDKALAEWAVQPYTGSDADVHWSTPENQQHG